MFEFWRTRTSARLGVRLVQRLARRSQPVIGEASHSGPTLGPTLGPTYPLTTKNGNITCWSHLSWSAVFFSTTYIHTPGEPVAAGAFYPHARTITIQRTIGSEG